MTPTSQDFKLPFAPPWEDANDYSHEIQSGLLNELRLELPSDHMLRLEPLTLLARRQDNDDILVESGNGQLAVVHLTWIGKKERKGFPRTQLYDNKKDFWEHAMKMDIEDFNL